MDMSLSKFQGDNEGQGSMTCYSPSGCRVRHNLVATEEEGVTPARSLSRR